MAITAAELQVRFSTHGDKEAERSIESVGDAVDRVGGRAGDATGGFDAFYNSIQGGAGPALDSLRQIHSLIGDIGRSVMTIGAGITSALAAPVIAGSWMSWNQVDSVEQATVAMNAYADSAEQVDAVLGQLLDYAQSDQGVLFQRQELFAAAQSMLMYGAAIENVGDYTEILSRSVGLGLSNWEDLNRVIGRIGSTGRLTGQDFDYLRAAGFDLDDSLRNINITWEELMAHLDAGIPADAMADQVDTIRGRTIRLQSALRGLGNAFLGVDPKTSQFIEGGIGDMIVKGMTQLTQVIRNATPAVRQFGSVMAWLARPVSALFQRLSELPEPLTTILIAVTGLTGVFLTGAGALMFLTSKVALAVIAFQALGGMTAIITGLGSALSLLAPGVAILVALGAALGGIYLAYQNNFMGFADFINGVADTLRDLDSLMAYLIRDDEAKTVRLDIVTAADASYADWQQMPDGTLKNATLDITATGSGEAFITRMENPEAPDGWDWTVNIDVTGDGIPDALSIIDSVNQGEGKFILTGQFVDEGGQIQEFQIWYDEVTGHGIFVDVEVDSSGVENVARSLEAVVQWVTILDRIHPLRNLQRASDAALGKIQEMADAFSVLVGIVADWTWGAITDTGAFQSVVGWIDTVIGRLHDLQGIWEWFKDRPLFGNERWESDGKGGITESDTGTTAVPVPEPLDFGNPALLNLAGGMPGRPAEPIIIDIKADDSRLREAIEQVSAMVSVADNMEATVSLRADESDVRSKVEQVSAMMHVVDTMESEVTILADASDVYQTISDLQVYSGVTIATSYVDIVPRFGGFNIPGFADGGVVNSPLALVGERGPELVSLPRGSYVHTNAETMRMMSARSSSNERPSTTDNSITIDLSGATFHNTSREEMNAWAEQDLLPAVERASDSRRRQMGVG